METIIKTIKVSDKGQIALPVDVRESANINIGDSLILIQKGKRIMIEKTEMIESKVKDDFKDLLKLSELSLKDLWDNEYDKIWNIYLKKK
ncbi:MAG: AbrB/MazE/SpoVT family DNA-binding domain-containing protein [Nanoarchaeota archaeon]